MKIDVKRYNIPTDKPWVATDSSTGLSGFGRTREEALRHLRKEIRRAKR